MVAQANDNNEQIVQNGSQTEESLDVIESSAGLRSQMDASPDDGVFDALSFAIVRRKRDEIDLLNFDKIRK